MRVSLVSTYDIEGGAARAAYRLYRGLNENGVTARLLVQEKCSDEFAIDGPASEAGRLLARLRRPLDKLPVKLYRGRKRGLFSTAWLPTRMGSRLASWRSDLIHLHWVTDGFMNIGAIGALDQPVVWTLHDMWAFTGGCHYDEGCGRYRESCGSCPALGSRRDHDLSSRVWKRKRRATIGRNWTIVTPSRWLADRARESSLLHRARIEVIPNGLDLGLFRPLDKSFCRQLLGLPSDKKLVLFGALGATSDQRKGFQYLVPALKTLSAGNGAPNSAGLVLGASEPETAPDVGLPMHYLGRLHDDTSLAVVYAAADVSVVPSIQENLANSVMESLACGTPVVAFDIGGMSDMVSHQKNGYLAKPFEAEDLAHGIQWVLADETRREQLSREARDKCEREFEISLIANRYTALYQDVLSEHGHR